MSTHTRLRTLSMIAAVSYGAGAALELVREQPTTFTSPLDYLIEAGFVGGLAATVAVLVGLIRRQRAAVAKVALGVAAAGNAALLVAATGTLVLGREVLSGVFGIGLLGIVAGYLGLAVVDLLRRLTPRLAGVILMLGFAGSIVVSGLLAALLGHGGDNGTAGGFALAAAWIAVGRLWVASPAGVTEPLAVARV